MNWPLPRFLQAMVNVQRIIRLDKNPQAHHQEKTERMKAALKAAKSEPFWAK